MHYIQYDGVSIGMHYIQYDGVSIAMHRGSLKPEFIPCMLNQDVKATGCSLHVLSHDELETGKITAKIGRASCRERV